MGGSALAPQHPAPLLPAPAPPPEHPVRRAEPVRLVIPNKKKTLRGATQYLGGRVATKIDDFVILQNFREIFNFVFREIVLEFGKTHQNFGEIFAISQTRN